MAANGFLPTFIFDRLQEARQKLFVGFRDLRELDSETKTGGAIRHLPSHPQFLFPDPDTYS